MELAADVLTGPLVELTANFRAGFDEITGRPALAAGGFAADGAAAGPVEDEIAWIGFAEGVDDEAVLVTINPGEITRVVVFEDAHGLPPPSPMPPMTTGILTHAVSAGVGGKREDGEVDELDKGDELLRGWGAHQLQLHVHL